MTKFVSICVCILLVFLPSAYINASQYVSNTALVSAGDEDETEGSAILWTVIGWALGKWIYEPLYDKLVTVYDQVNDYFVALRRANELEAEARYLFYQQYPNGNITDSGSDLFEEGREPLIPFGYKALPY